MFFDPSKYYIKKEIAFEARMRAAEEGSLNFMAYGAQTPWWITLRQGEELPYAMESGLPTDPLGGVLFQKEGHEEVLKALKHAETQAEHYGKHGLRAFMLAHHGCVQWDKRGMGLTSLRSWDEYNALIDYKD